MREVESKYLFDGKYPRVNLMTGIFVDLINIPCLRGVPFRKDSHLLKVSKLQLRKIQIFEKIGRFCSPPFFVLIISIDLIQ